jgi:quinol monooxygenase YgiN
MLKAKPGRRDEVKQIWDKYARDFVAKHQGATSFYYCFDNTDPDAIIVFGLGDQASVKDFAHQPWFADYQRDTQALLAEPPGVRRATPQYVKANRGEIEHQGATI